MSKVIAYLFSRYHWQAETRWFKKLIVFFALYKCLYWIVDFQLLFSANNIIYHNSVQLPWWKNAVFFLFNHPTPFASGLFIGLTILLSVYILILQRYHRIVFFILWLLICNINNNVFCTMTGGDGLFQALLFFCIFLGSDQKQEKSVRSDLNIALHNFGITAIHVQICIVYFLNAMAKLWDADWMQGHAVTGALALHEFSLPYLYNSTETMNGFLNYSVILYQLLFPVLVWMKKIKKWYLLIGVLQHLFIAFAMGLPSFGLIMILSYSAFYTPFKKS